MLGHASVLHLLPAGAAEQQGHGYALPPARLARSTQVKQQ
jgi:hypothetical protein